LDHSNTISDEQLAAKSQKGSLDAYEELVRRHETKLFHFLCQKLPSREDAQDLTQKTFLNVWKRIELFRCNAKFTTWLYTIARNLANSHYRKHGRAIHVEFESAGSALVQTCTPADEISRTEKHADLWRVAREVLKSENYDVLWLKYREEMSIAEIALVMKCTRTAAKVRLHRARKALGRALKVEKILHTANVPLAPIDRQISLTNC
jgi:RNA polymerase sigma-70 factor (ECF subfamily)